MHNAKTLLTTVSIVSMLAVVGCSLGKSADPSPSPADSRQTPLEKKEITMFMGDAGIRTPESADRSNNRWVSIVEQYANVDLKIEVPGYADFKTKYDLLLASGKLPDIVHNWYPVESETAAMKGAFIDLKPYYDKSPAIQKIITPEMMELAKAKDGKYYRLPMPETNAPMGEGLMVRYDLLQKYNNGKWPDSVEGWVDAFRNVKKGNPDAIPISNSVSGTQIIRGAGSVIYGLYGVRPYEFRIQNGKVISNFETPEFREATTIMRQLFNEGIVDKEFATNNTAAYALVKHNKDMLAEWNSMEQLNQAGGNMFLPTITSQYPNAVNYRYAAAPPLTKLPAVMKDNRYVGGYKSKPFNDHGVYISSTSKDPDRAWKVIEGFAQQALYDEMFWGKEGETYTVKDGKRQPIIEKINDSNFIWGQQYAIVHGYTAALNDLNAIKDQQVMGTDYHKMLKDSIKPVAEHANKKGYSFFPRAKLSEESTRKMPELQQFISKVTVEAIMGKITMEQFDQQVKEFKDKYGFIADDYTKYLNANKDELRKQGVVSVDW